MNIAPAAAINSTLLLEANLIEQCDRLGEVETADCPLYIQVDAFTGSGSIVCRRVLYIWLLHDVGCGSNKSSAGGGAYKDMYWLYTSFLGKVWLSQRSDFILTESAASTSGSCL